MITSATGGGERKIFQVGWWSKTKKKSTLYLLEENEISHIFPNFTICLTFSYFDLHVGLFFLFPTMNGIINVTTLLLRNQSIKPPTRPLHLNLIGPFDLRRPIRLLQFKKRDNKTFDFFPKLTCVRNRKR